MGFLSFRRGRKAPSPVIIPDCSPIPQRRSTLLDQFSQEVRSGTSASTWVVPDIINRRVDEHPYTSPTLQSPGSTYDSLKGAPLGLGGGNMNDFDDCDPNSSNALGMYQHWIDQDCHDEQFGLRQEFQVGLQSNRQTSPPIETRFNQRITPRSPQQIPTPYLATFRLYPHVSCPPPSVDDSNDDEEADEFSHSGHRCLISSLDSDSEDSDDGSDIDYNAPRYTIGTGIAEPAYEADFEADFEASETMWDSNRAILQGSDLSDCEDAESLRHASDPNTLDKYSTLDTSVNQVTETDFWSISTEIRYLTSRFFSFFDVPNSAATGSSVFEESLLEPNGFPSEQSLFSPTSVYNDDPLTPHDLLPDEQYPFSPSSPAARHPFSPAFAWPSATRDPFPRLQCPAEFNYSWICRDPSYKINVIRCFPRPPTTMFWVPKLAPTLFTWKSLRDLRRHRVLRYGPRPVRMIFGTGICDQFPFTFTHDEPTFPSKRCLCRFDVRYNMHPPGPFFLGWH